MSDGNYLTKPIENIVQFAANASLQIDIHDLLYMETDDVRPASSQADQGTEPLNQRLFASKFAGVAKASRQSSNAVAGSVGVLTDVLIEYPCASATFEIGDLVGASEAGSGDVLLDQQVEKVTDKDLAIGVVQQRYAAATTKVWVRLTSRVAPQLAAKATPGTALTAQLTTLTHTAPGTPDYAIQDLTTTTPYGFVTKDEGNSVLKAVANLQTRLAEVEAILETAGIVVAN